MAKSTDFDNVKKPLEPIQKQFLSRDTPPDTGESCEAESEREISETLKAFRADAARDDARIADATQTEFWTAVIFQSQAQRDEFWRKLKATRLVDDQYIDGLDLAKLLGIELETPIPAAKKPRKSKRWEALADELPAK